MSRNGKNLAPAAPKLSHQRGNKPLHRSNRPLVAAATRVEGGNQPLVAPLRTLQHGNQPLLACPTSLRDGNQPPVASLPSRRHGNQPPVAPPEKPIAAGIEVQCTAMRRFARHLLTILSALSLLLCVAVCVLWVRSFRGNEGLRYLRESAIPFTASSEDDPAQTDDLNAVQEIWILEWQRGLMRLCYLRSENVQIIDVAPGFRFGPLGPWTVASHFDYTYRDARSMPDVGLVTSQLVAPAWFAAAVTAVLPGVLVAHWFFRRARLRRASLRRCCAHCGYDLRAHREGERCPECGTASAGPVAGVTGPSHLQ